MRKITVILDDETLEKAKDWAWRRINWSEEVNEALKIFYSLLDEGGKKILKIDN